MGKLVSIVTTCLVIRAVESFVIKIDWVDGSRDGPSWSRRTVMDSVIPYLCNFFCCSPHYPRRQVGRTFIGTTVGRAASFQNTSTLKSGYWDRLSEHHDGAAARTVVDTMDRHKLRNPDLVRLPLKVLKGCFGLFMIIIMKLVG